MIEALERVSKFSPRPGLGVSPPFEVKAISPAILIPPLPLPPSPLPDPSCAPCYIYHFVFVICFGLEWIAHPSRGHDLLGLISR
ncbi:hypothetical protein BDW42DRAFT_158800 [Aspergillus taichungensis]|uniref:Uncharacterized protein n=1 Tax=Aspergillus taichungensis TaxID=482145 RepID=A0A2J5I880_9EURO|nr:hypothetical protein BDW42DRAFT_158800 [Aspergillus taichungensis]